MITVLQLDHTQKVEADTATDVTYVKHLLDIITFSFLEYHMCSCYKKCTSVSLKRCCVGKHKRVKAKIIIIACSQAPTDTSRKNTCDEITDG